jgi:EmrB/QacA subfamily drug resistance transporter
MGGPSLLHEAVVRADRTRVLQGARQRRDHDLNGAATRRRSPLLPACGGAFLAFLDVTITNLALPAVARDFGVSVSSLSWIVTLYTILFAALLAPAGRLADVVGRGRLFAAGVATFTVGSLAAALAPAFAILLIARAAQGIGAALLLPASLAFVLAGTPPARRPAAIGLWSASAALAAATGPALGGVLVDVLGWRSLFCINVPIGAWLVWRSRGAPAPRGSGARLPDPYGVALLSGGITLIVLAITEAQTWRWSNPATPGCLLGGAILCAAALRRSAAHPSPAVEISLWRNRAYAGANVISALFGAGLFASLLLSVLFLVGVWGYSELEAGLAMTPAALASALVGVSMARTRRRPSAGALIVSGSLLLTAAYAGLALWLPAQPHFLTAWLPAGLALGVGGGATSVGVSSAAALSVAPERFAAATGLNIAARQIGGALGVAAVALALAGRTAADGAAPFLVVYWLAAAASITAAIAGVRLVLPARSAAGSAGPPAPHPPRRRDRDGRTSTGAAMKLVTIRTEVKSDHVEDVEREIGGFFAALQRERPDGIRYTSSRLPGGTTYLTVLELDDGVENPLPSLPEFRRFQAHIRDWAAGPPVAEQLDVVATYGAGRRKPA